MKGIGRCAMGNLKQVRRVILTTVSFVWLALPADAAACPVCFGDKNSAMTAGVRIAILALIGITGTVLGGIASFFLYVRKRSKLTLGGTVDPPRPNGKEGF